MNLKEFRGVDYRRKPFDLADSRATDASNFLVGERGNLSTRPGYVKFNTTAFAGAITGLYDYRNKYYDPDIGYGRHMIASATNGSTTVYDLLLPDYPDLIFPSFPEPYIVSPLGNTYRTGYKLNCKIYGDYLYIVSGAYIGAGEFISVITIDLTTDSLVSEINLDNATGLAKFRISFDVSPDGTKLFLIWQESSLGFAPGEIWTGTVTLATSAFAYAQRESSSAYMGYHRDTITSDGSSIYCTYTNYDHQDTLYIGKCAHDQTGWSTYSNNTITIKDLHPTIIQDDKLYLAITDNDGGLQPVTQSMHMASINKDLTGFDYDTVALSAAYPGPPYHFYIGQLHIFLRGSNFYGIFLGYDSTAAYNVVSIGKDLSGINYSYFVIDETETFCNIDNAVYLRGDGNLRSYFFDYFVGGGGSMFISNCQIDSATENWRIPYYDYVSDAPGLNNNSGMSMDYDSIYGYVYVFAQEGLIYIMR